jgi:predicted aspartyl protease
MKKFLMLALFAISLNLANAQDKLFKKANTAFILNKVEEAKAEIDKAMTDPAAQSKAEGWLLQTRVYAELYFKEEWRTKYPGCGNIAFEAFKKYEALDTDYKMISEVTIGWRPLDLMYVTSFNGGRKFFDEKQWDSAYNTFATAAYLGEVIIKKDLRKNGAKIDTISVLYTAYSAQNGKKEAEASKYYEKFANLKIGGADYKDAYTYILVHAANIKDADKFYKYINIAKEVYPDGDWDDYEFDYINKNMTTQQKVDLYEKDNAAGTTSARKYLLFGQMFTDLSRDEKIESDSLLKSTYEHKALEAFKKAFYKDKKLAIAAFNAGVIYYNEFGVYEERYNNNRRALQELNSNKPVEKDPKKKVAADAKFKEQVDAIKKINADLEKSLTYEINNSIIWLEKSYNKFLSEDIKNRTIKNCLENSAKWLANCFLYKREKVKGKDDRLFDEFDRKYKFFDGLYGTDFSTAKPVIETDVTETVESNSTSQSSQTTYQLTSKKVSLKTKKMGDLYILEGRINDFGPFDFVYDPGATSVSISLTEFSILLKQNKISFDDVYGSSQSRYADGSVGDNTIINIRKLEIGGVIIAENVKALVSHSAVAPILLGQSFFKRFKKISQNNETNEIELEN